MLVAVVPDGEVAVAPWFVVEGGAGVLLCAAAPPIRANDAAKQAARRKVE